MNPAPLWLEGEAGKWLGGRVRLARGEKVFVIERRINGKRRAVALTMSEKEAEAELALFDRDPENYRSRKETAKEAPHRAGVRLDQVTLGEFQEACDARVKKGDLTDQYVKQSLVPYLGEWAKVLGARDLRRVSLSELKGHLKRWKTAEHKRVVALKAFTSWLREEDKLRRADDPTLDLKTPEIRPAKSARAKGYPIVLVQRLYAELISQLARDTVCLRVKTGMHDTEIDRIAQGGGVLRRIDDSSGIVGIVVFPHLKKGRMHVLSLDAQAFAAAERLQARGEGVKRSPLKLMIDRACERMEILEKVPKGKKRPPSPIQPGELRHSFATWSATVGVEVHPVNQKGVDLAKIAEVMGHLGKRTTSVFYVGDRVPMMIQVPVKLFHPEDPLPLVKKSEVQTG